MSRQGCVIGWFSAGITSAVAIKLAINKGLNVVPIYFETGSEHADNERFIVDCQKWYGTKIVRLKNPKYDSVVDLIRKTGYVNSPFGAYCTHQLKKEVRFAVEKWFPFDNQIFGFEYNPKEIKRAERFAEQYPTTKPLFPLIEAQLTKENCLYLLEKSGIEKPAMYALGYHNNNCIGCVKGGMGYWNKIRNDFPQAFAEMAEAERAAGHSCIKGVFLDELEPDRGRYPAELAGECGIFCPLEEFGNVNG